MAAESSLPDGIGRAAHDLTGSFGMGWLKSAGSSQRLMLPLLMCTCTAASHPVHSHLNLPRSRPSLLLMQQTMLGRRTIVESQIPSQRSRSPL